ncbi:hypothetical protein SEA_SPEEDDEMON_1490 [Gordonia phage SpeedDemon]|nr:hypothetical protein SEA_SPEEDDEMON_1490 [Gordonia phage SpeedDemon]
MIRWQMFLHSPFMQSPFMTHVKLVCGATVACLVLSLDYSPWR